MAIIKKKIWPTYFDAVASGKKRYELRLNDFEVNEGDMLVLEEWDPETKEYTGRRIEKKVTYVGRFKIDQLFFNYEIRTVMKVKYSKNFRGLDKLLYANGLVYFRLQKNLQYDIKPLVVHVNYVQGSENKKKLLQSAGMWYL